jgi:hypothetical protein
MGVTWLDAFEMGTQMTKRAKRVPPGTRINLVTASAAEVDLSLALERDIALCLDVLRRRRVNWEMEGKDAFEALAREVAHNYAVQQRTLRGKKKPATAARAAAEIRAQEIAEQLAKAGGNVKAVSIDRELSKLSASSERSVRRVKKDPPK